jgi:hypothetical protein
LMMGCAGAYAARCSEGIRRTMILDLVAMVVTSVGDGYGRGGGGRWMRLLASA